MRIAIFINTPAQAHFYKNILRSLEAKGNETLVLARDYGETLYLLDKFNINYFTHSKPSKGKISKILSLGPSIYTSYKYLRNLKPDLVVGPGVYDTYTSLLLRCSNIAFCDGEPRANDLSLLPQWKAFIPFVDTLITPASFLDDFGKKQIRVNSFKELAYLHPNYYKPNGNIKRLLDLKTNEEYVLLRFNAFDTVHDFGFVGFSKSDKIRLVYELEKYAKVFISAEASVPDEIKDRVIDIPKNRIHDVIYYARLLVAETGTMVTEAACLGTPAIILHSGVKKISNFIELENEYKLIYAYDKGPNQAIEKAINLIKEKNIKNEWKTKRKRLLEDKIDIKAFMVWFIENYPDSFKIMSANPRIQDTLK